MKGIPTTIACALAALALAAGGRNEAKARGGFEVAGHAEGGGRGNPATITFQIRQVGKGATSGDFLFAADDHRHYPNVIVKVPDVSNATFHKNTISFIQPGLMNDEPVRVEVLARDSQTAAIPDFFHMKVYNLAGQEIYHAHGDFQVGDIEVKAVAE